MSFLIYTEVTRICVRRSNLNNTDDIYAYCIGPTMFNLYYILKQINTLSFINCTY